MQRAWVSPYELEPRRKISELASHRARSGALLKVEFKNGFLGYADIFPWPELGDAPLAEQIALLAHGGQTPLLVNSIEFAASDASARAQGVSLWENAHVPLSHYLILDCESPEVRELETARAQGFDHFKMKLPADAGRAVKAVKGISKILGVGCKLRLDFNSVLSVSQFHEFLGSLPGGADAPIIDYIEDPTPWICGEGFGVCESPFTPAVDREATQAISGHGICPPVIIIKPAIQDWKYCVRRAKECGIRPVFTSYLDHPVGQSYAAWAAGISSPHEVCGLVSHLAYMPNEFSEYLSRPSPQFTAPRGLGIGFDELLASQDWKNATYK